MAKRRYQEGLFKKENGHYFSFFYRDRTFEEVAKTYMTDIGPQLSISTVRQRECLAWQILFNAQVES